ncbi:hypothetical protein [Campylobacter ureolyticus]|uniref:hypothetical protein n=1 Tax=Campylobacter ureolyticus TaxID=827 RepID=UPI0022B4632F|nr:hypothetical protein [Campylobacter ureolyticus]MCZ6172641.1 hypothetical protein [Campylobacter ureolyticus]
MTSNNIIKVKNRPSYYYFDRAYKDGKIITIKYSFFTDDILAIKINQLLIKFQIQI